MRPSGVRLTLQTRPGALHSAVGLSSDFRGRNQCEWPSGAREHCPVVRFHTRSVPSALPERAMRPSGVRLTPVTAFEWPSRGAEALPSGKVPHLQRPVRMSRDGYVSVGRQAHTRALRVAFEGAEALLSGEVPYPQWGPRTEMAIRPSGVRLTPMYPSEGPSRVRRH